MSTNAYRYMDEAELLKSYKRIIKKAERSMLSGFPARGNALYDIAQTIANEMDSRKDKS